MQSHILELRSIPEALTYFVTPKAVDENSVLLQQLPHWAACSITKALEFLTPAYKGHPRVMAYVLRVLESYPPERVTFFMPQLVQALRYDDDVSCFVKFFCAFSVWITIHVVRPLFAAGRMVLLLDLDYFSLEIERDMPLCYLFSTSPYLFTFFKKEGEMSMWVS